jgi:nicotinamide mononucleotide adenylyltransferase
VVTCLGGVRSPAGEERTVNELDDSAHERHPLLRAVLRDADGRVGVLMAVVPDGEGNPVAWLRPLRGGREWTVPLEGIDEAGDSR